ncbi:TIGR02587 family membrane protein [Brevundimonas sp. NIBR11]|uniref:TIGR02587 family membrane protein n=1 Tax=Brevundimonas sp. NIBR11 TaxID=3015999 RepID=UPI0022F0BBB4|nr:TIGR02587 family membrane protein [Brevundimonas sp. NIBR11]WGM31543.1 hypothetical protein KKHFBJBL_01790 [Brevundimonas sp. NIBR11]
MTVTSESYASGLGRACGGALLFGFPLLMTMEMWQLGFYMPAWRLALFLCLGLPLIYGLTYYAGFRRTKSRRDDMMDAFAALAVGFVISAVAMAVFGLIGPHKPFEANVGMVALQGVPAAMGAVLARKQFAGQGGEGSGDNEASATYRGELFLMTAGALFLAFNVAPTEEMILIGFLMTPWHSALLIIATLLTLHLVVFRLGFAGQEAHENARQAFFDFTLPGYAIAMIVSAYVLWSFGRFDGLSAGEMIAAVVVLAFPAALGAALARLVV